MTEPREIELWPSAYSARCSTSGCWRVATTTLRYVDRQGAPSPRRRLRRAYKAAVHWAESDRPPASSG